MRALSSAAQALQARRQAGDPVPMVLLVYLSLPVSQRWAVAGTSLMWAGFEWVAREVQISQIEDGAEDTAAIQIVLPGVSDAERALAFGDTEGAACTIWLAWVNPETGSVDDAVQIWTGEIDVSGWQGGPDSSVSYVATHRAALALQTRPVRYTDEEQRRRVTGDTSLNVDPATDAAPLRWPAASYFRQG